MISKVIKLLSHSPVNLIYFQFMMCFSWQFNRLIGTKIHLYEHHDHELNSVHLFDRYFEVNFVLGKYQ